MLYQLHLASTVPSALIVHGLQLIHEQVQVLEGSSFQNFLPCSGRKNLPEQGSGNIIYTSMM